ncbi:hypothetical protein [Pseudomonas graminis]
MSLTSALSSHRFSSLLESQASHDVLPASEPSAGLVGAGGEAGLLQLYTQAIRQATLTDTGKETLAAIPADSAFGAWWQHLFNASHSPLFLEWAKSKNIDTSKPITIEPSADQLTVTINGERITLSGSEQGPGWHEATGAMMAAAKALALSNEDLPTDPKVAPLILVARFHGEVLLPYRKEETLARATQLEHNQAFDVLGPKTYVNVEAQSPEVLEQLKAELGDNLDKFVLLQILREYDQTGNTPLATYLNAKRISTHPGSSFDQTAERHSSWQGQTADASAQDLLSAGGWNTPGTLDELNNLISALAAPEPLTPADGNYGGALAWPIPMSKEDQLDLFRIIADNQPPLPLLNDDARLGNTSLLDQLIKKAPRGLVNQGDAMAIMQWVLASPDAVRLAQALKQRMGEGAANATPREILLTALGVTLDVKRLIEPKEQHVAGFDLAAPEHFGQPLSAIKNKLVEHLVGHLITGAQAAPVAAMLLLNRAAPELLVADIPASVTYGSNAWFNFKVAVGRIEATNPGASAGMSFNQIVAAGAIDPVTDQELNTQKQVAVSATLEWGKAAGVLPLQGPYTTRQLAEAEQSMVHQQQAMLDAVDAVAATPLTQREVALAELRNQFGLLDFEAKTFHKRKNVLDGDRTITTVADGSYSMLDIYLSRKHGDFVWLSTNPSMSADMVNKLSSMPNPVEKHAAAFEDYTRKLSAGWSNVTKSLIANLALEDRKNLEWGQLTVYQRGVSERSEVQTSKGLATLPGRFTADDRAMIVKTERNGSTTYYALDPLNSSVRRRDDLKDSFKEGLQAPETEKKSGLLTTFTAPEIRRVRPSDSDAGKERGVENGSAVPKSFSSDRSEYLGKLLSDNVIKGYGLGQLKEFSSYVTTFAEEEVGQKVLRDLILGVIPGASAVYNLVNGNYKDAAADVIFDLVMFATTAGLGKSLSAAKGARTAPRPIGNALLKGLKNNKVSPPTAIPKTVLTKPLPPSAHFNQHQTHAAYQRSDVVQCSVRGSDEVASYTTPAKYDGAGHLVAFNPRTRRLFGRPLKNVQPAKLTEKAMQANMAKRYKTMGSDKGVCYNTALRAGQGEKALSPRVYDQILNAGNHNGARAKPQGYPAKWNEAMGITPDKIHHTIDLDSIKESGFINFYNRRSGNAGHTVYVQVTSDGQKVFYTSNSHSFHAAAEPPLSAAPRVVDESVVIKQDAGSASRIQGWMDKEGYDFSYSPSSEVNARVSSWP